MVPIDKMKPQADNIFQSICASFPEPLCIANTDRVIQWVNQSLLDVFGYEEADLMGKSTEIFYRNPEEFLRQGTLRFNKEGVFTSEPTIVECKKKSGSSFLANFYGLPIRDADNNLLGFLGFMQDISERRRFDEMIYTFQHITTDAAFSYEEKISRVLELATRYFDMEMGILSKIEGNIYTVKFAYAPGHHIEPETIFDLDETYCMLALEEGKAVSFNNFGSSVKASHPCYQKFALEAYIGVPVYVDGNLYGTLNFSSKKPRLKNFSVRDHDVINSAAEWLTYKIGKQMGEQQMKISQEKAEEANRAKTSFIANISHEVRTPLNGIMGYADILANMIDDPDVNEMSKKIQNSAQNLLTILNDVIDISKIELAKFEIANTDFSPVDILQETTDLFLNTAEKKGVKLSCNISPRMPAILEGDPIRIKQILSNVIGNAAKFTDSGEIRVKAFYDEKQNDLRVMVTDTGIGISPQDQEKIFDDFVQAKSGSDRKYGGTGLGLSISKKIIEMMDGHIKLNSAIGLGTTITITIPAKKVENDDMSVTNAATLNAACERQDGFCCKVLVVEDIPMNVEIATAMLGRIGCWYDVATNGLSALDIVQKNDYDIILMDIQMPDMDGKAVTEKMREMGITIPIIALTAHVMSHEIEQFKRCGMNGHIAKPLIYDDLNKTLNSWIS